MDVVKSAGLFVGLLKWWIYSSLMVVDTMLSPFKSPMNMCVRTFMRVVSGAKYAFKRAVVVFVLLVVTLWMSVLLYASFYHVYVPSASVIRPAHFKFRVCASGVGVCTFPMANVTLCSDNKAEVLARGQQYRVHLEMEVPDSAENRDVGMFMVMSRLYDRYGAITQQSSRSVALKYQSDLLRMIQTIVFSLFYITGFAEQTQLLQIDLFEEFFDDYYQPSVGVLLEVHSRQLAFYSAQLQFHASYTGLRYYLFYYPLTSAFFGIIFNCLWLVVGFMITWYKLGLELLEGKPMKPVSNSDSMLRGHQASNTLSVMQGDIRENGCDVRENGYVQLNGALELTPDSQETEVETVPRHYLQPFTIVPSHPPPADVDNWKQGESIPVTESTDQTDNGIPCHDLTDGWSSPSDGDDCKLRQRAKVETASS